MFRAYASVSRVGGHDAFSIIPKPNEGRSFFRLKFDTGGRIASSGFFRGLKRYLEYPAVFSRNDERWTTLGDRSATEIVFAEPSRAIRANIIIDKTTLSYTPLNVFYSAGRGVGWVVVAIRRAALRAGLVGVT